MALTAMDNDTYVAVAPGIARSTAVAAGTPEATTSSVAWPAIVGGALTAVAATIILMALGSGLGLASVAPWPYAGATLKTFTAMTAIWLIVVQWVSSGLGGYLTGRMRTKWVGVHDHEVFFRDTANGFLSWGLATVVSVALLASVAGSLAGGAARGAAILAGASAGGAAAAASSGGSSPANADGPFAYFADGLFRPAPGAAAGSIAPAATPLDPETRHEAMRIFATGVANGGLADADKAYLAQLVAARTGLPQAEAEKRVSDVVAQIAAAEDKARQAAESARKAGAYLGMFTALAMLIGAFIAAAAAGLGGHQRDRWSAQLSTL